MDEYAARTRHGFWRHAILPCAAAVGVVACAVLTSHSFGQQTAATIATPAAPLLVQFNGNRTRLPTNRAVSRKSGLAIEVDPRWSNSYGYRPVEVKITSPKPTTADHVITIRLHAGWNRDVNAEQDFEFPLGNTSATTTVSLPIYQTPMNYFWWDVWVDGVKDKDLSVDRSSSQAWMSGASGTNASLTFLIAGPTKTPRSLVATNAMELEALTVNLSDFPTRWIDYTSLDVVALSLSEAQQLAKQNPAAFEALSRWVRTGGQLWICDVGGKLEHLAEASKLLQLPESLEPTDAKPIAGSKTDKAPDPAGKADDNKIEKSEDAKDADDMHNAQVGWHSLKFRRGNPDGEVITFLDTRNNTSRTVRDPEVITQLQNDPNFVTTEQKFEPAAAGSERRLANDSSAWFMEQQMGLGTVRAFRGANEVAKFPQTPPVVNPNATANSDAPDELPRALSMGLRRTQRWDSRHGMNPDSANVEFDNCLVPGVGRAPVNEFRVLITLFVLLIGPVNYWILKRNKRLHLLVLTVPLAALITTVALFGYAIIADGFETQVRARSFTTLDQRTGEAACWTRLSYYSGLAPGKGLTMPADLVMYPILPSWASDANSAEERDIIWSGKEAELKQGWLNSRTPTQYLTIRARKSPIHLDVLDSGDKLRVVNKLGTKIKLVFVINEKGKIYLGEDLASDATAGLQPIDRADAIRRMNRLVAIDNKLEAPDALAGNDSQMAAMQTRRRGQLYGRYGNQPNYTGRLSDNLAGDALANLAGLSGRPALDLSPKSYVAITETGPEVEVGIPYAKEEASFHVLLGKW